MFSAFWAFQIFLAKLAFIAGALVLPFQLIMLITAMLTTSGLLLPKTETALIHLFKRQPAVFWELFLANGIQSGLGAFLSIVGIALTDAINAGFLVKMATVTTIIFASLILKESMSGLKLAIVIVMLFGAYLLTTKGQSMFPRVGDIIILSACICWSLGSVLVRKNLRTQSIDADVITMQKPLASLPIFLLLMGISVLFRDILGSHGSILNCCTFYPAYIPYAVGSGFCLSMAWIFLYRTIRLATASYMTLMSMITPIIVAVLAMVFLNERLVWIQMVGASLIVVSSAATYFSDIASK
jgi:drug/metabolite transporter (DMT)-like permease